MIFVFFMCVFHKKNCIRLQDLVNFELRFGFLMQNSIYGQMETLGNHQMGLRTLKICFYNFCNFYEVGFSIIIDAIPLV